MKWCRPTEIAVIPHDKLVPNLLSEWMNEWIKSLNKNW